MKSSRIVATVLRISLLLLPELAVIPAEAQEPLISNVFVETDLRQALEDISAQAGINVIVDPSVQGVVTLGLQDVTIDKALALILTGTGYLARKEADHYLVYTADETADMFVTVAETQIVRVQYVPAATARSLLPGTLQRYVRVDEATDSLAITAPDELLQRILTDLAAIDRPARQQVRFVPLTYVKATTARDLLPTDLQRFVRVDAERNTLAVNAPESSEHLIMANIAELDVPRRAGSFNVPDVHRIHIVKLNHATAAATIALLPASVQEYVRADAESNTLAISAPPVLLDGILSDVAVIDSPRKHIMLDARVVVLERADLLDFGGEWKWPALTAGTVVGDLVQWPWELRIGYTPGREFTSALSLTLNLLSQNNEATIIASPQVLAQDGKEAEIRVTTEEYFQITADNGTTLRAELEKIETGTILGITPQIGPNGELTLSINVEVSDVVARGEQNLPVVSRRTARSTVQLSNGGTAAIAGLVDTRSQLSNSGVPGMANVPLLGRAFRTDQLNHQTRQVAVFITATIVGENEEEFETGREEPPPLRVTDEALFREELNAALQLLEGSIEQ